MGDERETRKIRVEFHPEGVVIETELGPNLLELARKAQIDLYAPCGGQGQCGCCRVHVEGDYKRMAPPPPHMDPERDLVLACQCRPTGDVTVTVPEDSRTGAACILTESREGVIEVSPIVRKVFMEVPKPTLSDNVCDLMRVSRTLGMGLKELEAPLSLIREMADTLREGEWRATATVMTETVPPRLLDLEAGDTSHRTYGIAVDLGTTTVVGKLMSLVDGSVLSTAARLNGQIAYGEDVIVRIAHANEEEGGLEQLRTAILDTVREIVDELVMEADVDRDEVVCSTYAGNTVMEHLFLGVSPKNIRLDPYIPTFCRLADLVAGEVGVPINPHASAFLLPCRAGFVGGDITADVLACGMHKRDEVALMIDVGTNGEVVLGNKDWLMACSCSAGPAFEGGEVSHGMRAANGAIEKVEIEDDGKLVLGTIGGAPPRGICGSGLIDLIAELFVHGQMDRAGGLVKGTPNVEPMDLYEENAYGTAYVLAQPEVSATGSRIFVTEDEIKNVIRTKASMYAACEVLVKSAGITFGDLDRIHISGGFGRFLDSWKARVLGLLPDVEDWRFEYIGNGSLEGARLALLSKYSREESRAIFENMTYLELSVNADFMDEFTKAMFIPHTDLDRFPSLKGVLAEQHDRNREGKET